MKEIPITEIENIRIGCAQDAEAGTGCTVILCERGAPAGVDVRGGGPASRESQLLQPTAAAEGIHAVLLAGGSAFGLGAANGVMRYLAARGVGVDTGVRPVPLVCESCLFDLAVGSPDACPDAEMAYAACLDAQRSNSPRAGNFGAGTGATVGKLHGPGFMMKSGQGFCAVRLGELKVGAIAAVNALGDVYDPDTGEKLAGLLAADGSFADSEEALYADYSGKANFFTGNTTLGCVVTNGRFTKAQMAKVASMAHNGYARSIRPVHTTADGDSIYALSVGDIDADINVAGTLAARVIARAVARAALAAAPAYGLRGRGSS